MRIIFGDFEVVDFIWYVLGLITTPIIGKIYRHEKKKRFDNALIVIDTNDADSNVQPIAHGDPYFDSGSGKRIQLTYPVDNFHLKMPYDFRNKLMTLNPQFDNTKWEKDEEFFSNDNIRSFMAQLHSLTNDERFHRKSVSDEELKNLFLEAENAVCSELIAKYADGFFNGYMYAIRRMQRKTVAEKEEPIFKITGYRSDYFTHRVMAEFFIRLLDQGIICLPEEMKPDDMNALYPFLTSLGLDILLVIQNGEYVVLTKRSKKLFNMKDVSEWHMSVNEAVSQTDLGDGGKVSLLICAKRGIYEELGISENSYVEDIQNGNWRFSDVFYLRRPLEVGISAFIRLDSISKEDVREGYLRAKDSAFESTGNSESGLKFLKYDEKSITDFLNNKNEKISEAGRYMLRLLLAQKKNGF